MFFGILGSSFELAMKLIIKSLKEKKDRELVWLRKAACPRKGRTYWGKSNYSIESRQSTLDIRQGRSQTENVLKLSAHVFILDNSVEQLAPAR